MPKSTSVEKPISKEPEQSSVRETLRPGKLFACFELQRELGNGPTGAVWLAQDYSVGRQVDQVALRFLPEFVLSQKATVEALKNLIRRRTALKHPNILRVYDLVESKRGVAVQLEYLEGRSLSSLRLARTNQVFEAHDLEKWVDQLCEALEYSHKDVGLVHGDLVTGGLIIDSDGNLKLKDFGIKNCIAEAISRLKVFRDTGETLTFRSPQQKAGEQPVITDDLYSLGAIVYELLTGKPPLIAEIGIEASGKKLLSMAERRIELGIAGEVIPKHWEETVAACLAKDPAQRPQSAAEVKNRLKITTSSAEVDAKSIVDRESGPIAKILLSLRAFFARKRWLAIAGIVLIVASGSAIAYFALHPQAAPKVVRIVPPATTGAAGKEALLSVPTPSSKVSPISHAEISPTPSAEVTPAQSSNVNSTPSVEPVATPSTVVSPTSSAQDAAVPDKQAGPSPTPLSPDSDAAAIKEDVVRRINAIPGITADKKANLIEKMHKARSMERLAVIPFENGRSTLRRAAADELLRAFDTPEMRDRLSDPTIVLVVAGYADPGGNAELNLRISRARAENISRILKEQANLLNAMQTIGMGGTELLDSKQSGQNRAVEIWAVVPL